MGFFSDRSERENKVNKSCERERNSAYCSRDGRVPDQPLLPLRCHRFAHCLVGHREERYAASLPESERRSHPRTVAKPLEVLHVDIWLLTSNRPWNGFPVVDSGVRDRTARQGMSSFSRS